MAKTIWGRKESAFWPNLTPFRSFGALVLAIMLTLSFIYVRFRFGFTPMQCYYLTTYVRSSATARLSPRHIDDYRLLYVAGRNRPERIATGGDVVNGMTRQPDGTLIRLALSPDARSKGYSQLFLGHGMALFDSSFRDFLKVAVYDGSSIAMFFRTPLICGGIAFCAFVPLGIRLDLAHRRRLKYGQRLKGPELLTPSQFNRIVKGEGIGFRVDGMRTMLRIPKGAEAQHIQIIGDTGSGKSALLFQLLSQVRDRGDSAILYDPAREFVKRFYNPRRGDILLNPLDRRCPYWGPSEELRTRSEAKALAVSLFQPPQDRKGEFFIESPQKIFAHLLAYGPTPDELVHWMSNPEEIDRRLKGTEHAHLVDQRAHQQRAGVLASLGLVADSLRLLPKKGEGSGSWTATEWVEKRTGWIFLTSLPAEREALRPLQSLWIDWLVLRLLNEPAGEQKRVWFVIDELASLQRLPQLHTAITESRKSGNPVVMGFQGKAQLEYLYGHLAEVMLSQPATSVWLTTKEPKASQWVSNFIGNVEVERLRESHSSGARSNKNFSLERQVEPLVLDSEIAGLASLHAYMKYQNYVTRFSFPYLDMEPIAKGFEPRERPEEKLPFDAGRERSADADGIGPRQDPCSIEPEQLKAAVNAEQQPSKADDRGNLILRG